MKNKNGLYNKDFNNEVTKFAIKQVTDDEAVKTIFYDDFYGMEIEETVGFLNKTPDRNVVFTINSPKSSTGLKMILKNAFYNEHIQYNPYDLNLIEKHFNKVLFIGEYIEFFDVKVVDGQVVFENI